MRYVLDEGNFALFLSSVAIVAWLVQYSVLATWWRHWMGITLVGLAVALLLVYIPSDLALIFPAQFARFASTRWYQWLAVVIVNATAFFMVTRIITWDVVRRQRDGQRAALTPGALAQKAARLEAENAGLRRLLAGAGVSVLEAEGGDPGGA